MATRYSQYYTLNSDGRTYGAVAPTNRRAGEPVVVRASVTLPAGTVATDVAKLCPVVEGLRPIYGLYTASATNGSMTISLGYTGAATAILSASTGFQSASQTLLTPAQLAAITTLSPAGAELIATVGGTFTNATILTFTIMFVPLGS